MKKLIAIIAMLSLSILAGVSTANAQVIYAVVADIPFDFNVGNTNLPAGQYTVKPYGTTPESLMAISNQEGKVQCVFPIGSAQLAESPHQAELVFHHVGDRYFLSEVFDQENPLGAELPATRVERKLEKEAVVTGKSSYVTVAALK